MREINPQSAIQEQHKLINSKYQSNENTILEKNYVREHYEDGRSFEGEVIDGVKEGYGKLTYSDGAYYEGNFYNDQMHGKGTLFYVPGSPAYEGDWVADQFHGQGKLYNEHPAPLNACFNYNDFNSI